MSARTETDELTSAATLMSPRRGHAGRGPCAFCDRIGAGEYDAFTDESNFPSVVWFEPLNPVTPGHMLFVPTRHVPDALADPYTTAITAEIASRWWARKWGSLGNERPDCNLITSVGSLASQTVFHLHLHLIPRRLGDGLGLPWPQDPKCAYCYCKLAEAPECAAECAHSVASGHSGCHSGCTA